MVQKIPSTEVPHVLLQHIIQGPKLRGGSFSPKCQFRVPLFLLLAVGILKKGMLKRSLRAQCSHGVC
jgi:hypothetical protein